MPTDVYGQQPYAIRAEWGPRGLRELAPHANVVVVVDVLSFTTCVDLATARGAVVLPYRFRDPTAADFAQRNDALLAGENRLGSSLRPASLVDIAAGCRLVLPSPNGSTLSALAAEGGGTTLAGCLRNARAVAARALEIGPPIAVVASGERWRDDDTLRPALEDALGAGAIIAHLASMLGRSDAPSPDAEALAAVFERGASRLASWVADCASGREKQAREQEGDVELAAALDVSECAPQLEDGAYVGTALGSIRTSDRDGPA